MEITLSWKNRLHIVYRYFDDSNKKIRWVQAEYGTLLEMKYDVIIRGFIPYFMCPAFVDFHKAFDTVALGKEELTKSSGPPIHKY